MPLLRRGITPGAIGSQSIKHDSENVGVPNQALPRFKIQVAAPDAGVRGERLNESDGLVL
ncbi:MAG TPA: hypothetical protein VEK37_09735 [Gemmatimonadaceae bacterium]|nr:hypothetical protein [Gemmatimonadaceae bacterium]